MKIKRLGAKGKQSAEKEVCTQGAVSKSRLEIFIMKNYKILICIPLQTLLG
jgi:hypothetical protein